MPEYKKVQELTNKGLEHLIYPNGYESWYKDGKRHREGGPAVINSYGYEEWYLEGTEVSKEDYEKVLNCPLRDLPLWFNTDLKPLVKWRLKNEPH